MHTDGDRAAAAAAAGPLSLPFLTAGQTFWLSPQTLADKWIYAEIHLYLWLQTRLLC